MKTIALIVCCVLLVGCCPCPRPVKTGPDWYAIKNSPSCLDYRKYVDGLLVPPNQKEGCERGPLSCAPYVKGCVIGIEKDYKSIHILPFGMSEKAVRF